MKRKSLLWAGIIAIAVCSAAMFGGCDSSLHYKNSVTTDDGVLVYYNTHSDKAFVAVRKIQRSIPAKVRYIINRTTKRLNLIIKPTL